MNIKTCKLCQLELPLVEFHNRAKSKDGKQPYCKICNRKQRNEYYKTANGKTKNAVNGKRWRIQQRKFVYDYLIKNPCECGESDPVVLEFDHDDPTQKCFTIASKVGTVSNITLLAEMKKCTVRCANCHRRKTAMDQNWYGEWLGP